MKIVDSNYASFLNKEILQTRSYLNSSKEMSFSFRKEDNKTHNPQETFAYCALRQFNILEHGNGCQIMELENKDLFADEKFFDRIKFTCQVWNEGGHSRFDYMWFYVKDINENMVDRILEYINDFEYNKNLDVYIKYLD